MNEAKQELMIKFQKPQWKTGKKADTSNLKLIISQLITIHKNGHTKIYNRRKCG